MYKTIFLWKGGRMIRLIEEIKNIRDYKMREILLEKKKIEGIQEGYEEAISDVKTFINNLNLKQLKELCQSEEKKDE